MEHDYPQHKHAKSTGVGRLKKKKEPTAADVEGADGGPDELIESADDEEVKESDHALGDGALPMKSKKSSPVKKTLAGEEEDDSEEENDNGGLGFVDDSDEDDSDDEIDEMVSHTPLNNLNNFLVRPKCDYGPIECAI